MNNLQTAIENNEKFANKGFQNGRIATIVKVFYSKRKFDYCLNFCTSEEIEAGSYIATDGVSNVQVVQTI